MNSHHFIIPVSFFPGVSDPVDPSKRVQDVITTACINAKPSSLVSWGFTPQNDNDSDDTEERRGLPASGVVVGCEDGTLYIFHPVPSSSLDRLGLFKLNVDSVDSPQPSNSPNTSQLPTRPSRSSSLSSFRSAVSPFHVSRSRVVSGVTMEQAEAPKNYVDFDEEPEKLKEMLKGRGGAKEKLIMDETISTYEQAIIRDKPGTSAARLTFENSSSFNENHGSHLLSGITPLSTRKQTPPALRSPLLADPESSSPYSLSLKYHVFPPRFGPTRGVTQIRLISRDQLAVCLQEQGDVSIFSVSDGSCIATNQQGGEILLPPAGIKDLNLLHPYWFWSGIHILEIGETILIMTCATSDPRKSWRASFGSDQQEKIVFAVYQLTTDNFKASTLQKVGEWCSEGCIEGISFYKDSNNSLILLHVDASHRLISELVHLVPHASRGPIKRRTSSSSNIPGPLKVLTSFSIELTRPAEDKHNIGRIELRNRTELGIIDIQGRLSGIRPYPSSDGEVVRILIWSDEHLLLFERRGGNMIEKLRTILANVQDLSWINYKSFAAKFSDKCDIHTLVDVDADSDVVVGNPNLASNILIKCIRSTVTSRSQTSCLTSAGDLISTRLVEPSSRTLDITLSGTVGPQEPLEQSNIRAMWTTDDFGVNGEPHITALLVEGMDSLISGCSDGRIRRTSLDNICKGKIFSGSSEVSNIPLNGYITTVYFVESGRTKAVFLVGGADDGSVAVWSPASLQLHARWTLFITPLAHVIQFEDEHVGRLNGSVLCVAQDGTIAVIAVDGFQFLYLIPASISPLSRVCVDEDNLLLIYENSHARMWNIRTCEFWRSMSIDKAEDLLKQGKWTEWSAETSSTSSRILSLLSNTLQTADSAYVFLLDLEFFLKSTRPVLGQDGRPMTPKDLDRLRLILSMLLSPGLHDDIDRICREKLLIESSVTSVGYRSFESTCLHSSTAVRDAWSLSPEVSASRALSIITCLQALSVADTGISADVNTVITFYATSLAQLIGESYQCPSLPYLARSWLQSSEYFRGPARLLFDAGVARMKDEESTLLAERWQHHLPCLQPDVEKESITAATAVFICGSVAIANYSLLSLGSLTDISKSIANYLQDEQPLHKLLAIELCARGFGIWQQYVDAMEMLRALFSLSTYVRKEGINTPNIGSHARSAILQIASNHSQLFMTTLSLDIMNPSSVQHRKSIMQLVAFLIRKKPLIIHHNLTRLVEAVVKSLDPTSANDRELTLDAATDILRQVVQKFPSVDFHMASQRLAVGTTEGAIVMFDLKTATRLYVLEGHKKKLAACSFSPDGRRLVTVSLEESVVLVWKVGTSLSSFFNPGAPPRQGHGGSDPFKTLGFNVGDAGNMSLAATLDQVLFEWPADRTVRLKIGDIILTFST